MPYRVAVCNNLVLVVDTEELLLKGNERLA